GLLNLELGAQGIQEDELLDLCRAAVNYSVQTCHPHFKNQLYGGTDPYGLAATWLSEALNTNIHTYEVAPVFVLVECAVLKQLLTLFELPDGDGIFSPVYREGEKFPYPCNKWFRFVATFTSNQLLELMAQIMGAFQERFNKASLRKATLLDWERRAFAFGNVKDRPWCGRKKKREETCAGVAASIEQCPIKSTRKRAAELGGSMSNMYGMVLARYKAVPDSKTKGLFGIPPLVAFASEDGHYSVKKGAHWLGIGTDNVIPVKTDSHGRLLPSDLIRCVENAIAEGKKPFFVTATSGTTVLGAFDPLEKLADICQQYGMWLHVDACWGGSLIFSKKHRHLLQGLSRVDSVAWNAHKMLGAPLQCSVFLTREKELMHHCNSASASYLFQQDKFYDVTFDTGDKSVQCGRKVDAFKLWLMWKARGDNGFESLINNAMDAARYRVAPKIKEKLILSGSVMIGYQPLPHKGLRNFFRFVTSCHPPATHEDMDYIWQEIERHGADL
ncbi:Cysteine sulfinic acid decarboxylase, partial [Blattella germanica]